MRPPIRVVNIPDSHGAQFTRIFLCIKIFSESYVQRLKLFFKTSGVNCSTRPVTLTSDRLIEIITIGFQIRLPGKKLTILL